MRAVTCTLKNLLCGRADPPVRGRPPGRPVKARTTASSLNNLRLETHFVTEFLQTLNRLARGPAADQGVRPTFSCFGYTSMQLLCCLLLTTAAHALPPIIRDLQPHGAERGRTVEVKLRGDGLLMGMRLKSGVPGTASRLNPPLDLMRPGSELPFLLTIPADAPVGLYPLRLISEDGMSNVVLFAVGDLPESEENEITKPKELNNSLATAEKMTAPGVMNGTLTSGDEDYYAIEAKAGQKLVIEVEARRAGSAIDPAIEVYDAAGKLVAKDDDGAGVDPRMEVTFAKAGTYKVRVHDTRYSDQAQNFYRLKIGSYSYAEALFPLGAKRGASVNVELVGGNLAAPVTVKASALPGKNYSALRLPNSSSLPLQFVWSDSEETLESPAGGGVLKAGVIVNGRIAKPGEVDKYKLAVKPGEDWLFEVKAGLLGTSKLDAILTVFDAKGKKLASRDDIDSSDPVIPLKVPEGVTELTVAVEDLLGNGGAAYGYRLEARREQADYTLTLLTPFVNVPAGGTSQITVLMQRRGFEGGVNLGISNLPPGFSVAGGHILPEAAAQNFNEEGAAYRSATGVLTITAEPGLKYDFAQLEVTGVSDTGMKRSASGPGLMVAPRGNRQRAFVAPWLEMGLPMAVSKQLPVTLAAGSPLVHITQGFEYPLTYKAVTKPGAKAGKINNTIASRIGNLRILKGAQEGSGVLVNTNFATPMHTFDMLLSTDTEIDGRTVQVVSPAIEIQVAPGFLLKPESTRLKLTPGGKTQLKGTIWRDFTFEGTTVRIGASDLPDNVTCQTVELPVPDTAFTLMCEASAQATPGSYDIKLTGLAPEVGHKAKAEYKIPDMDAKLVIVGSAQAAR